MEEIDAQWDKLVHHVLDGVWSHLSSTAWFSIAEAISSRSIKKCNQQVSVMCSKANFHAESRNNITKAIVDTWQTSTGGPEADGLGPENDDEEEDLMAPNFESVPLTKVSANRY